MIRESELKIITFYLIIICSMCSVNVTAEFTDYQVFNDATPVSIEFRVLPLKFMIVN